MVDTPISKLALAGSLAGDEPVIISQRSSTVTISGATISALASDQSFNDSANGFVTAGFAVGNFVIVEGFTGDTANNIYSGEITALTAGKMTIGGSDGAVIVDDAAGETVTISKWESKRLSLADLGGGSVFSGARLLLAADETGLNYTTTGFFTYWDTEDFDTDGYNDIGGSNPERLTVPEAGYYDAQVFFDTDAFAVGELSLSLVAYDSSDTAVAVCDPATDVPNGNIEANLQNVYLETGGYFAVRVTCSDSSITVRGGATNSFFTVRKVGS